MKLSIAVTLL